MSALPPETIVAAAASSEPILPPEVVALAGDAAVAGCAIALRLMRADGHHPRAYLTFEDRMGQTHRRVIPAETLPAAVALIVLEAARQWEETFS